MATSTPWGPSQHTEELAKGVSWYSTASHGGVHLSPTENAKIHPAWRVEGGWYEEDCAWAIVAFHFPDLFLKDYAAAIETLKHWMPDAYMRVTGTVLTAADSRKLAEREFCQATKDKWVAISAINALDGMVKVTACIGGRLENGQYASRELRNFMVPANEYEAAYRLPGHRFVIDPTKHKKEG